MTEQSWRERAWQYEERGLHHGIYKILGCWLGACRVTIERESPNVEVVSHEDLMADPRSVTVVRIDLNGCDTLDAKLEQFTRSLRAGFADVHPDQHEPIGTPDDTESET